MHYKDAETTLAHKLGDLSGGDLERLREGEAEQTHVKDFLLADFHHDEQGVDYDINENYDRR